jgi:hypothetical protein
VTSFVLWMLLAAISFPLRHACEEDILCLNMTQRGTSISQSAYLRQETFLVPRSAIDVKHSQSPCTPGLVPQNKLSRLSDHGCLLSICITLHNSTERIDVTVTAQAHAQDVLLLNLCRATEYPEFKIFNFLQASSNVVPRSVSITLPPTFLPTEHSSALYIVYAV